MNPENQFVIGDVVGSWVLLLPLLDDSWLAADSKGVLASVCPCRDEDFCRVVCYITDMIYFLGEFNKLSKLHGKIKKTIEWKDFVDICKGCARFSRANGVWVSTWEKTESSYWIAYGRLRELVPEPNWLSAQKNTITYRCEQ